MLCSLIFGILLIFETARIIYLFLISYNYFSASLLGTSYGFSTSMLEQFSISTTLFGLSRKHKNTLFRKKGVCIRRHRCHLKCRKNCIPFCYLKKQNKKKPGNRGQASNGIHITRAFYVHMSE